MKIDYVSDTHLDFYSKSTNPQDSKFSSRIAEFIDGMMPDGNVGEVLIVAGDTGHYNSQNKEFFRQMKEIYKEVIVVSGNHDLYLITDSQRKKYEYQSTQRTDELQKDCEVLGVHYLDGNIITIDGIRFGGCAGWYDLPTPADIRHWKQAMNDSNLIYDSYPVQLAYAYQRNSRPDWDTQAYYEGQLQKLKDVSKEGCDILINHISQVIPPNDVIPEHFKNDPGNIFYYVDNEDIVKSSGAKFYLYGHTHDEHIWERDGIQMRCNPFGYPMESRGKKIQSFEI